MRTIGLLGGMSWESSLVYYRLINEAVRTRCGELHSAKCIMHSVDFSEVAALQRAGDWDQLTHMLATGATGLRRAGAEMLVICTNTMHYIAEEVYRAAEIPLVHIADAVGADICQKKLRRVGLLGTKFTMEMDFYRNRLEKHFGIEVITPSAVDRQMVHDVIFNELCRGILSPSSKSEFLRVVNLLSRQGAEGIVLGCTEIPLLITESDAEVTLFDTTAIHAKAAIQAAFDQQPLHSSAFRSMLTGRPETMVEY